MELLWKALAVSLLTAVLGLSVGKQEKELFVLLAIAGCTIVVGIAISYLKPVLSFLRELEELGDLHSDMLGILIKAIGVGLITEIAAMVCSDSGNASLGKVLQILGSAAILWLSIPVFQALLDLIGTILGEL